METGTVRVPCVRVWLQRPNLIQVMATSSRVVLCFFVVAGSRGKFCCGGRFPYKNFPRIPVVASSRGNGSSGGQLRPKTPCIPAVAKSRRKRSQDKKSYPRGRPHIFYVNVTFLRFLGWSSISRLFLFVFFCVGFVKAVNRTPIRHYTLWYAIPLCICAPDNNSRSDGIYSFTRGVYIRGIDQSYFSRTSAKTSNTVVPQNMQIVTWPPQTACIFPRIFLGFSSSMTPTTPRQPCGLEPRLWWDFLRNACSSRLRRCLQPPAPPPSPLGGRWLADISG